MDPAQTAALELRAAHSAYLRALENYQAITPCQSPWPSDPPGPNYPGTTCELTQEHNALPDDHPDRMHRRRILGTTQDVRWW